MATAYIYKITSETGLPGKFEGGNECHLPRGQELRVSEADIKSTAQAFIKAYPVKEHARFNAFYVRRDVFDQGTIFAREVEREPDSRAGW